MRIYYNQKLKSLSRELKKDIYNVLRVIEGWIEGLEKNNPLTPFNKGDYNHVSSK